MQLNHDVAFSKVFAGSGEQAEIDKPVKFYQHGLYFGADGRLLVDHPYNADKIALLTRLGLSSDEVPSQAEEVKPMREPVNQQILDALADKDDEEIQLLADELVSALHEARTPTDFKPNKADRAAMVRFIAKHTS
jgi:hypothetical protein